MTEEQIARLEQVAIAAGLRVDTAPFLRIVEERRRLLNALKQADRCGVTSQTEDEISAAIAYADESA